MVLTLGAYQSKPMIMVGRERKELGLQRSYVFSSKRRSRWIEHWDVAQRPGTESPQGRYVHTPGIKGAWTGAPVELQAGLP